MKHVNKTNYTNNEQHLIRLMQGINAGCITNITVRNGQPECTPKTAVEHDIKFNRDCEPDLELDHNKLPINNQILWLLRHMAHLRNGTVRHLEIQRGIPRSMKFVQSAV